MAKHMDVGVALLTPDVARIVIKEMETYRDVAMCSLVCKVWNNIAKGIWDKRSIRGMGVGDRKGNT